MTSDRRKQPRRQTERLAPDGGGVSRAGEILRAGGLVAFPTETVYGLGADATYPAAVAAIYEAKARPATNPLIVHVPDRQAASLLIDIPLWAGVLAEAHWPGPMTLVGRLRQDAGIARGATAGLSTLAVRVPGLHLAREVVRAAGRPIAAPSANPSGRVSPTTAEHVRAGLDGRIDAILEGGPCTVGLESAIVDVSSGEPVLLRPGGIGAEALAATLGRPLSTRAEGPVTAPGMLASHYAPGVRLRLRAKCPKAGEGWLGFGPDRAVAEDGGPMRSLSPTGDLREAAANLFAHLRALDAEMGGAGTVAVAAIPDIGLGVAINDRLRRAAAPRP